MITDGHYFKIAQDLTTSQALIKWWQRIKGNEIHKSRSEQERTKFNLKHSLILPYRNVRLGESILSSMNQPADQVGVLLCGDFYTVPNLDKRGGSGDVTSVWNAFAKEFSWIVGVAGNHDTFGVDASKPPKFRSPLHFLDCNSKLVGGLEIAGISGIVGDPKRTWRKSAESFESFICLLASMQPDILLMHDGPDLPEFGYRGTPAIREALELLDRPLVIRGHAHWEKPLAELANGLQVLNVEARVVVLRQATDQEFT